LLIETLEQNGIGEGKKSGEQERSGECEKILAGARAERESQK